MRTLLLIPVFISSVFTSGQKQDTSNFKKYIPKTTIHYFKLGNTLIPVKTYQFGNRKNIVMLNMHDDEMTSVNASMAILEKTGGLLIKIENKNKRNITFVLNKKKYMFDPNRMFSRSGIISTLKRNQTYDDTAVVQIQRFAAYVLKKIPTSDATLIALHNNADSKMTVLSYKKGGHYENDTKYSHISVKHDPDNFFLTTDVSIYKELISRNFNAVLQDNKKAKNDGSLSIYYGRKNWSYVNVETEIGKKDEQEEMIRMLLAVNQAVSVIRKK